MLLRKSFWIAVASIPTIAQAAPAATPSVQPIPRSTFLQNMDADFSRMDSNHDGKLSKAEIEASQQAAALRQIVARNQQIFRELDKDHNGQLSPAEFEMFHAQPPAPNSAPMLQHFDANHDGVISQIEFRAGTLANFDRLDSDKDGIVTAAEMKAGGVARQ